MNDALMGILRVRNLVSPPYISSQPSLNVHRVSKGDRFVILGSDGLFDFFSNDEAVKLVHSYILSNPSGDPAKYLLEKLLVRAAENAGIVTTILCKRLDANCEQFFFFLTYLMVVHFKLCMEQKKLETKFQSYCLNAPNHYRS